MDEMKSDSTAAPKPAQDAPASEDSEASVGSGESASEINRSVARAFGTLEEVAHSKKPLSFVDLRKRLHLPKATLHKLLLTLEALRYVDRDRESGRYSIGLATLELAAGGANRASDIRTLVSPVLRRLVEQYNETANLGVLDGEEEVLIERIDPPDQIVGLKIGWRHPAYGSSGGRACLAARGETIVASMPEKLKALTENTIRTRRELQAHLRDVREQGYALDLEECYPGVRCVGVAIDVPGWPALGLAFTLPLQRASIQRLHELAKPLLEAKNDVERILAISPRP
jgi:IclR family acetate operon transcriptional repressor